MSVVPRLLAARVAIATGVVLLAGGCFAQPSDTASSDESGRAVLDVALPYPPVQAYSPFGDDAVILSRLGVTESLTVLDESGAPQPALAESWERVDPRTWTFTLREGVRFQDGEPLDADAVVGSLRAAAQASPPPSSIDGLDLTVESVNETTVQLRTGRPDPLVPQRLSAPGLAVLSPGAYDGGKADPRGTASGPFTLTRTQGSVGATLTAHDGYWDGRPGLAGIEARYLPESTARTAAFTGGEVDLASTVAVSDVPKIGDALLEVPLPRTVLVSINAERPDTDTPAERATVADAVDQVLVADTVFEGRAAAAEGLFGAATPWAADRPALPEPPAAEQPDGPVTIATYPERAELPVVADAIAAALREDGVEVKQVVRAYTALEPDLLRGAFDVVVSSRSHGVDTGEPSEYLLSDFGCDGGYNLARLCDPRVERALADLADEQTLEGRREAALAAEHAVLGTGAVVPVVHEQARYAVADGLTGLAEDPYERLLVTAETTLQ